MSQFPKSNRCTSLDIYGRPVQLTFHGQEKIKTPIGACLTFFIFSVMLIFALSNSLKLDTLRAPIQTIYFEESFYEMHKSLDPKEVHKPNKVYAFGLGNTLVSPQIGKFVVRQNFRDKKNEQLNRYEELPIAPCL